MKHPNNKPAIGVPMVISPKGTLNDGTEIDLRRSDDGNNVGSKDKTDNLGHAMFTIDVPTDVNRLLTLKVEAFCDQLEFR